MTMGKNLRIRWKNLRIEIFHFTFVYSLWKWNFDQIEHRLKQALIQIDEFLVLFGLKMGFEIIPEIFEKR